MTKRNINILILSAGRRVELVKAFQEALRAHFPGGQVIAADANPVFAAACHMADRGVEAPYANAPGYIEFLLALCREQNIGMVIPTIDTELILLSRNRAAFKEMGVELVVSDQAFVEACRDKRRSAEIFAGLGIDQPAIYERDSLIFPCFCKPYDGSCSIGARPLLNSGMLTADLLANEKNMFMEMVGPDFREYTVDAYYGKDGILRCLVPRERIEVRAGEISKGATRKGVVYRTLLEKARRIQGARGCITLQVFFHPETGAIKGLEINPRIGGGFPISHAAGADYPAFLVREYFLGHEIAFTDNWEDGLLILRYDAKVIVREHH